MYVIPQTPGEIAGGSVLFEEKELLDLSESVMRKIRGGKIGMIFQDPMTCLNPTMTVGNQIGEGLKIHLKLTDSEARRRSIQLLEQGGIPTVASRINSYPNPFSGGRVPRV